MAKNGFKIPLRGKSKVFRQAETAVLCGSFYLGSARSNKNIIVSKDEWNDFYENNFTMTEKAIRDFAKRQKIPVACVIGRMQKEGYVSYKQFAKLKESADIKSYDGIAFE